jgi:hypothetical protein
MAAECVVINRFLRVFGGVIADVAQELADVGDEEPGLFERGEVPAAG